MQQIVQLSCLVVADVSGFVEQIRQPDLPGVLCYQQLDCACSKPVGSCQETDKPWQCSVLRLDLARGLAGSLFYDRYTVIIFQDIDDGLEELSLLAHQLKLLLSSLIRCSGVSVLGSDIAQLLSARIDAPWLQSCRPCLRNHTRTVDRPWMPYRTWACL